MGVKLKWIVMGMALALTCCAEGHCRHSMKSPAEMVPPAAPATAEQAEPPIGKTSQHVFVYKYDGSLQCKRGKAISLESMAKKLKGITVYSSTKKSDGLMHIQACGTITGQANVYEISAKDLAKAESRGFKQWNFE